MGVVNQSEKEAGGGRGQDFQKKGQTRRIRKEPFNEADPSIKEIKNNNRREKGK